MRHNLNDRALASQFKKIFPNVSKLSILLRSCSTQEMYKFVTTFIHFLLCSEKYSTRSDTYFNRVDKYFYLINNTTLFVNVGLPRIKLILRLDLNVLLLLLLLLL